MKTTMLSPILVLRKQSMAPESNSSLPSPAVAKAAYQAAYPVPVELPAGTKIKLIPHKELYPGWVWGEAPNGERRWFPQAFLDLCANTARLKRNYNSVELSVLQGDVFNVIEIVAGWGWCATADKKRGWLPLEVIDFPFEK